MRIITNNYIMIDDYIQLDTLLTNLTLLGKEGILVLGGVPHIEMIDDLKEFKCKENIDIQSLSKPLFGEDKSHSIPIEFNDKSKIVILDLAHKYIPEPEIKENKGDRLLLIQ